MSDEPTGASRPTNPPPYPSSAQQPPPMPAFAPSGSMQPYPLVGKVRGTGVCILLCIVTLGIYSVVWFYQVHHEMERHKGGSGLGGGIALVLALFVSIVMPYITSSEVGEMYERRGQAKPVSGLTGLWNFPGIFILVGPLIWFVKTNGALNAYWRSFGAQ